MNKIGIIVLVFLAISCQSKNIGEKSTVVEVEIKEEKSVENHTPCKYSQNLDKYINEIVNDPKKFINDSTEDDCVLSLIDSINTRSINQKEKIYFEAIGAICNISDGYVSEHLTTIALKQYYHNLKGLLSFINENKCFREVLVLGLSMEVSVGGDRTVNKIKSHAESMELIKEQKELVQDLISEIDPEIFD